MSRKAGWKWPESVKAKMRASAKKSWTQKRRKSASKFWKTAFQTGTPHPMQGKTQSTEQRRKVAAAMKGKPKTEAHRRHLKETWEKADEKTRYARFMPVVTKFCKIKSASNPIENRTKSALRKLKIRYRSQKVFFKYIVDIYLPDYHVVLECDGSGHDTAKGKKRDVERDAFLSQEYGLLVLHLKARDIMADVDGLLGRVLVKNPLVSDKNWRLALED